MPENLFSPSPVVWTSLIGAMVALPILIHLINLMRHRRVKWAAMDFLLQSYRKRRNWIRLKQFLLLLARITALVLALMMFGQIGCQHDNLAGLLGSQPVHHYILLDDSYSMSDQTGSMTVFERARKTVQQIAARVKGQQNQRFTLLRFSRCAQAPAESDWEAGMDQLADINGVLMDDRFDQLLETRRNLFDVSELAAGPNEALEITRHLLEQRSGEKGIVYLVSDFRADPWSRPAEIETRLSKLNQMDAEIFLVNCVRRSRSNLAITQLKPISTVRAAEVPVDFEVTVHNYGDQPVQRVQLGIFTSMYGSPDARRTEGLAEETAQELPTVYIESISPGQAETRRFSVYFSQPGRHAVRAALPPDPVAADNQRWATVDFVPHVPVLLVDDSSARHAYYLSTAIAPGRRNTGIRPEVVTKDFLRNATDSQLDAYHAIYLLDLDRLDETAVKQLEGYLRRGGGVGIFLGPRADLAYYNRWLYRDGDGFFPLPLDRADTLPELIEGQVPDIQVTEHPIFSWLQGNRNTFLDLVTIESFIRPPRTWTADEDNAVDVIARLRGDAQLPLIVQRRFGQGKVLAFLTTAAPDWNNWINNPTFVVMALRSQEYLATGRHHEENRLVGGKLELKLAADRYRNQITFLGPQRGGESSQPMQREATASGPEGQWLVASIGGSGSDEATHSSGIYEATATTTQGDVEAFRWAVNVQRAEGDLQIAEPRTMLSALQKLRPKYLHWDELDPDPQVRPRSATSQWLLIAVLLLLAAEQVLAYSASYHRSRGGARA